MIVFTSSKEKEEEKKSLIPEVNIGVVGHVDHGKTTLTQVITGKWTDTHSEEIKRGITIRLGYADTTFYFCAKCSSYGTGKKCQKCFADAEPKRTVSFIDAPGHETLMATVLSGAALMDGALLLISADEKCPRPQTAEHLKALDIVGIKKIVIVQNKVDIVSKERAMENYREIKEFVKGTVAENAPIIPISAVHNVNIDALIETINKVITTPKRDIDSSPKFFIARSFDVNKPGEEIETLKGGVVGGSVTRGKIKVGDEIEILPGVNEGNKFIPLRTRVAEIIQSGKRTEAVPGGLAAIQTELDPSLTKSDMLSGSLLGYPGKLPPIHEKIKMKVHLFDHIVGVEGEKKVEPIKTGNALMLTAAIAKTVGVVTSAHKDIAECALKLPVCAEKSDKIAISSQVGGRWHLIGWGEIL